MSELTALEVDVLLAMIEQEIPQKAADKLRIPEGSIRTSLAKLRRKFNVRNNAELIAHSVIHCPFYVQKLNKHTPPENEILTILTLPKTVTAADSMSKVAYQLCIHTAYYSKCNEVDEFMIERVLTAAPWIISLWDEWQNKRANDNAWHIRQTKNKDYWVYGDVQEGVYSRIYTSATKAYAVYIKNELERIRCHQN